MSNEEEMILIEIAILSFLGLVLAIIGGIIWVKSPSSFMPLIMYYAAGQFIGIAKEMRSKL